MISVILVIPFLLSSVVYHCLPLPFPLLSSDPSLFLCPQGAVLCNIYLNSVPDLPIYRSLLPPFSPPLSLFTDLCCHFFPSFLL